MGTQMLLIAAVAIVVAALLVPAYDALQKVFGWLKTLPAPVTQMIVGFLNLALNYGAVSLLPDLGCAPNCTADQLTLTQLSYIMNQALSQGLTYLFKQMKTSKELKKALTEKSHDPGA